MARGLRLLRQVVQDGTDVVVVEAGATFRAPARFDDEIDVELAIDAAWGRRR